MSHPAPLPISQAPASRERASFLRRYWPLLLAGVLGAACAITIGWVLWVGAANRSLASGRELIERRRWREAIVALERYVRLFPNDAEAWMLIARAHSNLNDVDASVRALRQVPLTSRFGPEAMLRIAESYEQASRALEAEMAFKQCIKLCESNESGSVKVRAQMDLLNICLLEERWTEAEALLWDMYAAWSPVDEQAKPVLMALVGLRFNRRFADYGASVMGKYVAQDPDDYRAKIALGKYYIELGMLDEGKAVIQQCVAKHPQDLDVRVFWLGVLDHLGDAALAEEALRNLPEGWEERSELWTYHARACFDRNELDQAAEFAREALKRNPFNRKAHALLASTLSRLGKNEEAQLHRQTSDDLRQREEELFTLFQTIEVQKATPNADGCLKMAELTDKLGMHRLAYEWARFALAAGNGPILDVLEFMPVRTSGHSNPVRSPELAGQDQPATPSR